VLAACLLALAQGETGADAQAGALMVAELMTMIRGALTKRSGRKR
jgi:hypothetical protein